MKLFSAVMAVAAIATSAAAQTDSFKPVGPGKWQLMESKDPMTDSGRGIAFVSASDGDKSSLVIKCDAGANSRTMYITYISSKYLGATTNKYRDVMFRFDQNPPETMQWFHNGTNASLLKEDAANSVVSKILTSSRMVVRATTFQYETVTSSFDVTGGKEAISRAYAACGRPLPPE